MSTTVMYFNSICELNESFPCMFAFLVQFSQIFSFDKITTITIKDTNVHLKAYEWLP